MMLEISEVRAICNYDVWRKECEYKNSAGGTVLFLEVVRLRVRTSGMTGH